MHCIAYTVKGLEEIAATEITRRINGARIMESAPKRVLFDAPLTAALTQLRTVDDIGLLLGEGSATSIDDIAQLIRSFDIALAQTSLEQLRPQLANTFSLTLTLAGVRGYTADELAQAASQAVRAASGWEFTELDHSNFDLRLFVDRTQVYCSVRLAARSLHERAYKTVARQGSLRPTIAAAMVTLATDGKSGLRVVDNFCGSGTILAEALLDGHTVAGGDLEPESVDFTRQNLAKLSYDTPERIVQLDALKSKWPARYFDCAISNLPWGKQIEITRITDLYRGTLQEYARILKPDGTLCLLIGSKPELLVKHAKQIFPGATIRTLQLGYLGQTPTIVTIQRRH